MNKKLNTSLMGLCVFLASCANAPQYIEPQTGPIAKVRIVQPNPKEFAMMASSYDLNSCTVGPSFGWVSGGAKLDTARIGMLDSVKPQEGIVERRIPAGQKTAVGPSFLVAMLNAAQIMFSMTPVGQQDVASAQTGQCSVPIFTPEPDGEYEILVHPQRSACSVVIQKLTAGSDGKVVRTPVQPEDQQHVTFFRGKLSDCPK